MSRNIPSVLVALHLLFYNFVSYVIQVSRTAYINGGGEGFVAAQSAWVKAIIGLIQSR